jgi:hypothetical protein
MKHKDVIFRSLVGLLSALTAVLALAVFSAAKPLRATLSIWAFPYLWSQPGSRWAHLYFVLWGVSWFLFWGRLMQVSQGGMAKRLFSSSLFVLAAIPIACILYKGNPMGPEQAHFVKGVVTQLFFPGLRWFTVLTFPLLQGGLLLVEGLLFFGWVKRGVLERELSAPVEWPGKVIHAPYFERAIQKGTTYLGYEVNRHLPVYLSARERNQHVHVIGSTGSGKTHFVLMPMINQDIRAGRGVIFVDAKGNLENAKAVFQMARDAGREKDFLFLSMNQVSESNTYNPLQNGNPSQLKDKTMAYFDWTVPYYKSSCENALLTLFMDLERIHKTVTLCDLAGFFRDPPKECVDFNAFVAKNKDDIQHLRNGIDVLVKAAFGRLLATTRPDIDFLDVYRRQKIVYFAIDTQSYLGTAQQFGRLITQDILTLSGVVSSTFKPSEIRPLAIYIDEYQSFGTRSFVSALAKGRDSGLWITIAHQSLGDLKAVDDSYAQQINELTNTKIFLRVNDPSTAQFFSDTVGTTKEIRTTRQVLLDGADPKNLMGSERVVHEYLIHPTELKNFKAGQAVYKSIGHYGYVSLPGFFPDVDNIHLPKTSMSIIPSTPSPVKPSPREDITSR